MSLLDDSLYFNECPECGYNIIVECEDKAAKISEMLPPSEVDPDELLEGTPFIERLPQKSDPTDYSVCQYCGHIALTEDFLQEYENPKTSY